MRVLASGGHLLVHPHQPGHTGSLVRILDRHAVGLHDGFVVCYMGLAQLRRHGERVVQICQRAVRIQCARVEDPLVLSLLQKFVFKHLLRNVTLVIRLQHCPQCIQVTVQFRIIIDSFLVLTCANHLGSIQFF